MAQRQYQADKFKSIYNHLNAQQKKAVDAIEGPVMVIAGPGTGKTQILAARIGKILIETDTQPENILCLTYTEAAVVAMRKRLTEFLGAAAYKINICTYHAFCNDVIQDNLPLFEKTNLDPVSELERTDYFVELIDAFSKDHPLKRYRGDVYFEINNLQWLFSTMKLEGWTPGFLNERIDAYITSLPQRDEYIAKRAVKNFKKGDVRTDKIEEEKERINKLRAAVNEFDNFQNLLSKHRRYDFDDMINWVIKAFEENENLLRQYQEQFLYILVDEYQDTNGSQNKLVQQLINFWDAPNVFVVGDDDQSIYRFQGANVENMLSFAKAYNKDLLTVVLTDNYRSSQPILDVAKTLIERNNERLISKIEGLTKDLSAANDKVNSFTQRPRIIEYENQQQEMMDITLQAETLIQQGIAPGRIAVIYRENKYGEELSQYFAMKNIPVYSKRSVNILTLPQIQKIILLLEYLHAEHDAPDGGDEMLFEILHLGWFHIPPVEIAKLSIEVADRQFTENKTSIRRLLYEKIKTPHRDLFSQGIDENLKRASVIIESLIADVPNITLQQLLENIIRKTGMLQHILKSDDKAGEMQALTTFFSYVKEETRRNPFMQLHELVRNLQLMMDEGISLPMPTTTGNEKGVNLLTAHGSKG
ncbi:MAG TPA: ATP-dependent helicase, partial [Chitinophagaceae bacterium]|nr:ATP-dependent helicase [Chitinophagaceae bacterium]